jgi:DNA replication and repair protein RecF
VALKSISVRGFRNLAPGTVELARDRNYLFGPNGAGKTNLLEAVHYLAIGRSFRRCPDSELLGFGQEVLVVSGEDENGVEAEIRFNGSEKRLLTDGVERTRLSDYFGWLPVVVLLLEDIELVQGGPGARRAFLDMAIAKTDRSYITVAAEYRRVLLQRNRLLETGAGEDQLTAWTDELVRTGVAVAQRRRGAAEQLLAAAGSYCEQLARAAVRFEYRSSIGDGPGQVEEFRQQLAGTAERERQLGRTLVGPHRDDVRIVREEKDLRRFGSVGEQRLAGIALRLAESDLLLASVRQRPVFLLDEIASELDEERGSQVLELIAARGQMVYAAARKLGDSGSRGVSGPGATPNWTEFRIESGRVMSA